MLNILRKNTKIIIWFIILSFCLWGAFSVGIQMNDRGQIAGRVFGRPVSFQEFNKFLKASEIFSMTGARVEDPGILEQHAWQNIIFAREAKRQKIQVSDDDVRNEIKRLLAAQKVPLDDASYQMWVRSISGTTPRNFEEMVRETLRIQKLLVSVQKPPVDLPADQDLRAQFLLDQRQLAVDAVIFSELQAAQNFHETMLKDPNWRDKASASGGPRLESVPLQSLRDLSISFGLDENQVKALYALDQNAVSSPQTTSSGRVILFNITSKKEASESDFDVPETAAKYRLEFIERIRYQQFLKWHNDLIQRSRFEAYTQP